MSSIFMVFIVLVSFVAGLAFGFAISKRKSRVYDGALEVSEDDATMIYQLEINTPPEQLKDKTSVTFAVVKHPTIL